jgi:hypothetical protein
MKDDSAQTDRFNVFLRNAIGWYSGLIAVVTPLLQVEGFLSAHKIIRYSVLAPSQVTVIANTLAFAGIVAGLSLVFTLAFTSLAFASFDDDFLSRMASILCAGLMIGLIIDKIQHEGISTAMFCVVVPVLLFGALRHWLPPLNRAVEKNWNYIFVISIAAGMPMVIWIWREADIPPFEFIPMRQFDSFRWVCCVGGAEIYMFVCGYLFWKVLKKNPFKTVV